MADKKETEDVQEFCRGYWRGGCLIGDLSRENPDDLTDDEVNMLHCAREGFYAGADFGRKERAK